MFLEIELVLLPLVVLVNLTFLSVIMKKGRMECIGTSLRLKNKFGAGYKLTVLLEPKQKSTVEEYFNKELGVNPLGSGDNFTEFNIPRSQVENLPKFFKKLE